MSAAPVGARPSPLSIRLTDAERRRLEALAGNRPLSTYVKAVLFSGDARVPRSSPRREDAGTLARILAVLGQSGVAENLERIARQAEAGTLYCDDALRARIANACASVQDVRALLMQALGKNPEGASDAFRRAGGSRP